MKRRIPKAGAAATALLLALILFSGCAGGAQDPAAASEADAVSAGAPAGPEEAGQPAYDEPRSDSGTNDWKVVSNGEYLYYPKPGGEGLLRGSAPFAGSVTLHSLGYRYISVVGDTAYYWTYNNELFSVRETDPPVHLYDLPQGYDDVTNSWFYRDKLYFFVMADHFESVNTLWIYDLATGSATRTELTCFGEYPTLIVFADHIYYDTYEDAFGVNSYLLRAPLDDPAACETLDARMGVPEVFEGKLYVTCKLEGESQTAVHVLDPQTLEPTAVLPDIIQRPYWIEGNYAYCKGDGDEPSLVRVDLTTGQVQTLFTGVEPSNTLRKAGDYLYFDHYNSAYGHTYEHLLEIDPENAVPVEEERPAETPKPTPKPEVSDVGGTSYLYLESGELSACFKLCDEDGNVIFTQFLEPNRHITKSFPSGWYILKIAEGSVWISDQEAFGAEGHYSQTTRFHFTPGDTFGISTGPTGNVYQSSQGGFVD